VTTLDPGASEVFTNGFTVRPFSTAFFARSPAASITDGLLVFVQLVMAAIKTLPCRTLPFVVLLEAPIESGVGRLLAISSSVVGLVFRAFAKLLDTGS
jgi:hypothetical protein